MRFLVVGAGAVGGYFGGRLLQAGEDVTFLVRPKRREQLQETGLRIESVNGDFAAPCPALVAGEAASPFDVILLTVKAYHFDAMERDLRPYVGAKTVILPLLNGYDHYPELQRLFGKEHVLGGLCTIETTLSAEGVVLQTSPFHQIAFGEWDGGVTPRVQAIAEVFARSGFLSRLSEQVQTDVWHKYILITVLSGITTLLQAPIGPILADEHALATCRRLLDEVGAVARAVEAPVDEDIEAKILVQSQNMNYNMKSSMLRDMEKGFAVEADHLHGNLLQLAREHGLDTPLLSTVYANLKVYETKRARGL